MRFILLLVDMQCIEVTADSKQEALSIASDRFGYDNFDLFMEDLNYVEWETDDQHYYQNVMTGETTTYSTPHSFNLNYFLKQAKATKQPIKALLEEFDDLC